MPVTRSSLPVVLDELAGRRPDAVAYTYVDYELDPAGFTESLTWAQVLNRARVVAGELASVGSPGDRVGILAPQGLEYVVAVFGALEAGLIAVPLSVPMLGVHDERVVGALGDCAPVAVLTTSAAVGEVVACVRAVPGLDVAVVEVDALDVDGPAEFAGRRVSAGKPALLQYTSGSTRSPAGVVVTHDNIVVNLGQMMSDHYGGPGQLPPEDATVVSWLPFYHDLGLQFGIFYPLLAGLRSVVTSPMAFLQKPARWMQLLASYPNSFSGGPNFAFELAVRRTSDADMAGLDLGNVLSIASGAERVHAATIRRFSERFGPLGLPETALRPGYGLAEATVYVSSWDTSRATNAVRFDYDKLSAGHAERSDGEAGVELVSNGVPQACTMRIVDPEARVEKSAGQVGEIWVHGANVADGYWRNPEATRQTFGGRLVDPSPGTPSGPWLCTGDLGVICEGELFIVGRSKDLLIIDGRNHYPDDIEATIQEISGGRVAALAIPDDHAERLVTVVEVKAKGSGDEVVERLRTVRQNVASAVSTTHGVRVADVVLVGPGALPITTSGKIRRASCAEQYRQNEFARVDNSA